jgi:uncharacterized protein YbaA (DUF1428 family)
MTYYDGMILPVPQANEGAYRKHATDAAPLFQELGVTRIVENLGNDVPDGKVTDFKRAVNAEAGENVVFSWFEYPSKDVRDQAHAKMMEDPRMKEMGETMPFDGKRMIMAGFETLVEEGQPGDSGYTDGFVVPVPDGKRDAYRALAQKSAGIFREYGALCLAALVLAFVLLEWRSANWPRYRRATLGIGAFLLNLVVLVSIFFMIITATAAAPGLLQHAR